MGNILMLLAELLKQLPKDIAKYILDRCLELTEEHMRMFNWGYQESYYYLVTCIADMIEAFRIFRPKYD